MKRLVVLLLTTGCISTAPANSPASITFQVARSSPQDVQSCLTTQHWQNAWVITAALFGALGGLGGLVAGLVTDSGQKLAFGIASGGAGAVGSLATSLAGIEANIYAQKNCQPILLQAKEVKK